VVTRRDLDVALAPSYRPTGEMTPTKIASFGNFTPAIRAKFPKLVILNGPRAPKEIMRYGEREA